MILTILKIAAIVLASFIVVPILAVWLIGDHGKIYPSTWKGFWAGGWRSVFTLNGLHLYIYGRWTNKYLHWLIHKSLPHQNKKDHKHWSDHYHGKVLTHEEAKAMMMLDHDILNHDLEHIIPYPIVRDLVMKGPPEVVAYECACRHSRPHHCEPTQVCMIVGQPFVDFILEHHPDSSRKLTKEEAVTLLKEEHERGHLHSAWFKDACLNRFYCICNCCKCCCGGIEAMVKYGSPMMASSGYVVKIDEQRCSSCGTCVEACPFNALLIDNISTLNWEKCMGCGVCTSQCPSEAITLIRDERKGTPLDVRLM